MLGLLLLAGRGLSEPVAVRHAEGLLHGFLTLRSLDGRSLAEGELLQTSRGDVVTSELVFRFKDGSVHDEKTVFSQAGPFRLVRYELKQKGPTFPRTLEFTLDGTTGEAAARYTDDGQEKVETERLDPVPTDLANGLVPTLLKNLDSEAPLKLSMLAATPKPRLVGLEIEVAGEDRVSAAGRSITARHYVVKVALGGIAGLVAPLVGKQPPDTHVWILPGPAPAFLRVEGALYVGGPVWRIDLANPAWPKVAADAASAPHSPSTDRP